MIAKMSCQSACLPKQRPESKLLISPKNSRALVVLFSGGRKGQCKVHTTRIGVRHGTVKAICHESRTKRFRPRRIGDEFYYFFDENFTRHFAEAGAGDVIVTFEAAPVDFCKNVS